MKKTSVLINNFLKRVLKCLKNVKVEIKKIQFLAKKLAKKFRYIKVTLKIYKNRKNFYRA